MNLDEAIETFKKSAIVEFTSYKPATGDEGKDKAMKALAEHLMRGLLGGAIESVARQTAQLFAEETKLEEPTEQVCAYCLDTGWMKVRKMRGEGYNSKPCVWCKDGKDKLEPDQLATPEYFYGKAVTDQEERVNRFLGKASV